MDRIFNEASCMDNMFDFFNGYISRVTSSFCACFVIMYSLLGSFLAYLLKHQLFISLRSNAVQKKEICVCVV